MSGGIFYLDEDRQKDLTHEPTIAQSDDSTPSSSSNAAGPPSLVVPGPSLLTQTQPFGRKSGVFAATPSFPSPLAQAITVPSHSDSSSSANSSPQHSDEESPHREKTPLRYVPDKDKSNSSASETTTASSSRRSSRPPSPAQARQVLTPGALLMNRAKRSGSGSFLGLNQPVFSRQSPPRKDVVREPSPSDSRSGSSGRAALTDPILPFGSPELDPEPMAAPRPLSVLSPAPSRGRDGNILGLGWTPGWDNLATGRKDAIRAPSPRKERDSPAPNARQRRASEFLRPSSMDLRKISPMALPSGKPSFTAAGPSLSTSASLISPLNPLPSPWSEVPLQSTSSSNDLSSSLTSTGSAIRLNRVPTSVRLAADLIKTSQTPPLSQDSHGPIPTPNPSPAESDQPLPSVRKFALGPSASLPGVLSPNQRWAVGDNSPPGDVHSHSISSSLSVSSDTPSGFSEPISVPHGHSRTRSSLYESWSPPSMGNLSAVNVQSPASVGASSTDTSASSPNLNYSPGLSGVPVPGRLRSVSQKGGLAMDLAGVSSAIGDAANHANMIMQSRQAKVQRWKPGSFDGQGVPPFRPFTSNVPSRLSASFVDRPPVPSWASPQMSLSPAPLQNKDYGGIGMEKQVSATGTIAGIEWVDWYDCYKAYKAEKIRAELAASKASAPSSGPHSPVKERDSERQDMSQMGLGLTPVTSREDSLGPSSFKRRSLSIRSTMSSLDPKSSPAGKRALQERQRQSSGNSQKSADAQWKRKRNLVTKMEGWWNSVKSNFSEHPTRSTGLYPHPRIPSAPQSRRGSDHSGAAQALVPPEPVRRKSSSSGKSTGVSESRSHANLRQSVAPLTSVTQPLPALTKDGEIGQVERPAGQPTGLEARRKQPLLRLDLEPHVLQVHGSDNPSSSRASHSVASGSLGLESLSGSETNRHGQSRSSSYGFSSGLTPGLPRWDQTPSPLAGMTAGGDKPVAPGAFLTVSSVRDHVKQRLNAAKEQCDTTLRRIIGIMTVYEDARMLAAEPEEPRRDYFDTFSDSPVMDPMDSEDDAIPSFGLSSQSPSRRGSISMSSAAMSSPSRRLTMLSSMPSSPRRSMSRRRPSMAPRAMPRELRPPTTVEGGRSASSSRSNSRSRSPLPHRPLLPAWTASQDPSDNKFLSALQELILLATDVLDMSVNSLISRPTACLEIIQKLQKTGQYWDENEEWPGRDWYVDILMAVASLGRVLDWWEAEKGFWNFDEDNNENEPLDFILRPAKDTSHIEGEPTSAQSTAVSPIALPVQDPSMSTATITLPPLETAPQTPPPHLTTSQAIDDLRALADKAKSVNIVMELSLQGEEILYVNDAIYEVIGRDPEEVLDRPISDLLAPADTSHFTEATESLLEDDNNTVELRFRFEVHEMESDDVTEDRQPGPMYIELEGVGMLIREDDVPSHTMWVMKPVTATQVEDITDALFPRDGAISTEGVLCRICEREIVVWFFEKHNETCDAVHRLEAEIADINECLGELKQILVRLLKELGDDDPYSTTASLFFYKLPESLYTRSEVNTEAQGVELRKVTSEDVQDAIDILDAAVQIETPSVLADEADLPFNVQRYLSRESEDNLTLITRWQRPPTSDRSLASLFTLVEHHLRSKHKATARMQSTIRYSEKTRHEWEDRVNQMLAESDTSASDSGSDTQAEGVPEHSPPGPRKIAPLARLPITQGHPHRHMHREASDDRARVLPSESAPSVPALAQPTPLTTISSTIVESPEPQSLATPQTPRMPSSTAPVSPVHAEFPSLARAKTTGHSRRMSVTKAIRDPALSPRIPAAVPARNQQPSIKDFEIIKPISRGAFGSVYLARKVATGDYYAIKALKKADMIAKNQVTNVKAERTILMNQSSSPYVAKLYFSFQSKDYLYLVMEYLNGGDCATLVKALGGLPIDWARNYIGELVLGLEYLHARNIAHRDIKPDNLLIDSRGHLKLTDFGLSKIGLLNRQIGGPRAPYLKGASLRSTVAVRRGSSVSSNDSPILSPDLLPGPMTRRGSSYFSNVPEVSSAEESSGSESAGVIPKQLRQLSGVSKQASHSNSNSETPRFVGTPDYLSPESILGGSTDDRLGDWWATGVVLYEFLYGFPPFHADSPEKVFDNIVSRRIDWHDDECDVSTEARDLMDRLMCTVPIQRLGARGAAEVKQHAFFAGINWTTLATCDALFVPDGTDPESTDYFDLRGANNTFQDDESLSPSRVAKPPAEGRQEVLPDADTAVADDFGAFTFRNLPVLKQANDDVIRRIRSDSIAAKTAEPPTSLRRRKHARSISRLQGPPSPATSTSSAASTPSRLAHSPTASTTLSPGAHVRRPSEVHALERLKLAEDESIRRNRTGSISSTSDRGSTEQWKSQRQHGMSDSIHLLPPPADMERPADRPLNVLIAEDNPISQKILETLLQRMGCHCVCVQDGPDALAAAMGSIKFDVILCDIHMPYVSGEQVARMIRSTVNANQNTPIIAATAFDEAITEEGTLFSAVLAKPFTRLDLLRCLAKVGFVLGSSSGAGGISDIPQTPI